MNLSIDGQLELSGRKAHPVGIKKPDAWGWCDMHGNVMERCRDWYQRKFPGGKDPEVRQKAGARTVRGGSWCGNYVRSAFRLGDGARPDGRGNNRGFRVVAKLIEK